MLDIDRDGELNILNLMHLQKNINPESDKGQSQIGLEVFKMTEFFIATFLSQKGQQGRRGQRAAISYELFTKILGRSCLID